MAPKKYGIYPGEVAWAMNPDGERDAPIEPMPAEIFFAAFANDGAGNGVFERAIEIRNARWAAQAGGAPPPPPPPPPPIVAPRRGWKRGDTATGQVASLYAELDAVEEEEAAEGVPLRAKKRGYSKAAKEAKQLSDDMKWIKSGLANVKASSEGVAVGARSPARLRGPPPSKACAKEEAAKARAEEKDIEAEWRAHAAKVAAPGTGAPGGSGEGACAQGTGGRRRAVPRAWARGGAVRGSPSAELFFSSFFFFFF